MRPYGLKLLVADDGEILRTVRALATPIGRVSWIAPGQVGVLLDLERGERLVERVVRLVGVVAEQHLERVGHARASARRPGPGRRRGRAPPARRARSCRWRRTAARTRWRRRGSARRVRSSRWPSRRRWKPRTAGVGRTGSRVTSTVGAARPGHGVGAGGRVAAAGEKHLALRTASVTRTDVARLSADGLGDEAGQVARRSAEIGDRERGARHPRDPVLVGGVGELTYPACP